MLELYINDRLIPTTDDIAINLVKELGDTDSLNSNESEYSYEAEIPATDEANTVFNYANEIDVSGKFTGKYRSKIYDGGVCLFDGLCLLNEITKDHYKVNFYKPGKAPLTDLLGDKQLSEITPHWKMVSTYEDIQHINDWHIGGTETTLNTDDTYITFPYMLRNLPMNPTTETRKNFQQVENALINDENAYPAYSVTGILKDMFSSYGYKVDGNIFDDPRFTNLYESASTKDWNGDDRYQPCYLDMTAQYRNALSDSCYVIEDERYGMKIGVDKIMKAGDGVRVGSINDTNKMLSNDNSTLVVPRTGWYHIRYNGDIRLNPTKNGYAKNTKRGMYFPSSNCDSDPTDLTWNPIELKLVKSDEGNKGYVSSTMSSPYKTCEMKVVAKYGGVVGADLSNADVYTTGSVGSENIHKYPKNGCQMDIEKDGLISGVRTGSWRGTEIDTPNAGDYYIAPNRRHAEPNDLNLQDPSLFQPYDYRKLTEQDDDYGVYDIKWIMSYINGDGFALDHTYQWRTAFALLNKDSKYNLTGWEEFNSNNNAWNERTSARKYDNLLYSSVNNTDKYNCHFDVSNVVYLKKGDSLDFILTTSYADVDFKDGDKSCKGITNTEVDLHMWMGLLNTEDDLWTPTKDEDFTVDGRQKPTNVNALLGTRKCSDWLKNLCQTFNLSVTENGTGSYLIDTQSDTEHTTNIIGIDDKAHPHDAVFRRIDLPSKYSFRFTNKEDERGPMATNRDGGKEYLNPSNTTGEEQVVESKYSYNWYFPIEFEGIGERMVPIACDDKRYGNPSYTYKKAYEDGDYDPTPRLMYVPRTAEMISYPYLPLLVPSDTMVGLTLDFDSISDTFFNVTFPNSYEVEVELYLTQADYANINLGTKVSFNGNLYKVSSITFDASMQEPAELVLVSIV